MLTTIGPHQELLVPPHPDGPEGWAYAIVDSKGQVVFADDAGELVALLIEGYDDIDRTDAGHDRALLARYEALVEMAERSQRFMVDQAVEEGRLDPLEADEETLTALFAARSRPWEGGRWDGEVPLMLIATDYEPYTERPRPTGRVLLLDPATEPSFLRAVADLGLLELLVYRP